MASINTVTLLGNLGADPEAKQFPNGGSIVTIRLATTEKWKDKGSGESRERTEWHTVTFQGEGLGKVVEQYLAKGDMIYVTGQLRTRSWEKDGEKRYATEINVGPRDTLQIIKCKAWEAGDGGSRGSGAGYGDRRSTGSAPAKDDAYEADVGYFMGQGMSRSDALAAAKRTRSDSAQAPSQGVRAGQRGRPAYGPNDMDDEIPF